MLLKIKTKSLSKSKDDAWKEFSKFIRLRDCLLTSGQNEWGLCYTCLSSVFFKYGQAGHFIPGRSNDILFDEKQVHLQCYVCNIRKKGNWAAYYIRMIEDFGEKYVKQIIFDSKKKIVVKLTVPDFIGIANNYKFKYEQLLKGGVEYAKTQVYKGFV